MIMLITLLPWRLCLRIFPEAEVVTFDSPIKALEEINNLPDVVLVDYYMPEMNGNDFCVRIKNNPETSFIPVILITVQIQPQSCVPLLLNLS